MPKFIIDKRPQGAARDMMDTVVQVTEGQPDDEWCTIQDLDQLFEACKQRWGSNWDLQKLKTCVAECEFD